MQNLLLEKPQYRIEETPRGVWRRYLHPNLGYFAEYRTHARLFGMPLIHYTRGICPETGRRLTARGILAVGRVAIGGLALGQAAFGLVALGQAGFGVLFGLGQAASGIIAIGQLALGVGFGLGQFATGWIAIGQFALGVWVLAQVGIGEYAWTTKTVDPQAQAFFHNLLERLQGRLGL
jgi:hypothetical protein